MADTTATTDIDIRIPWLSLIGGASVPVACPKPTALLSPGGEIALTAPGPTVSFLDAQMDMELSVPVPSTYIRTLSPTTGVLEIEVTPPVSGNTALSTWVSFAGSIAAPTATIHTNYTLGSLLADAPAPIVAATTTRTSGAFAGALPAPAAAVESIYTLGWGTVLAPSPRIAMAWSFGSMGSLPIEAPIPEIGVSGYTSTSGALPIVVPAPVVTVAEAFSSWKCLAINTDTMLLSEYTTNYDFVAFSEIDGNYLALHRNGNIYLLGGNLDVASSIAATFATGRDDLGSSHSKRMDGLVVGLRSSGELTYKANRWDEAGVAITIASTDNSVLETRKLQAEKTKLSRTFGIEISNVSGADFSVDSMELFVKEVVRRSGGS